MAYAITYKYINTVSSAMTDVLYALTPVGDPTVTHASHARLVIRIFIIDDSPEPGHPAGLITCITTRLTQPILQTFTLVRFAGQDERRWDSEEARGH